MSEQKRVGEIKLRNVRLSFEHIYKPSASVAGGKEKYRASFLLDKKDPDHKKQIVAIKGAIQDVIDEAWGGKEPKFKEDRYHFLDGEDCTNRDGDVYDGYHGMMVVKASNDRRPKVLDKDKTPLTEADGKIYSGCYVNAIVRAYAVKGADKGGNGLFFSLEGVQFKRDGEAFGGGGISDDAFDDESDDEDGDTPRRGRSRDDDDEEPTSRGRSRGRTQEDDEDEPPRRAKRSPSRDDDEDEPPRRAKRSPSRDDDEDEPPRRTKRRPVDEDDDELT